MQPPCATGVMSQIAWARGSRATVVDDATTGAGLGVGASARVPQPAEVTVRTPVTASPSR
jgi:hypothetical protein